MGAWECGTKNLPTHTLTYPHTLMFWPLLVILLVVLMLAYLAVAPPRVSGLVSRPQPVASYARALERLAALHAQEAAGHNPLCHTQLLTHGQKTGRVIAF